MPSVEENLRVWDQSYDWTQEGNEWSAAWGGPEAEWFGTIFPRIHGFLPNGTILEIAPGFGRWTHYLKDYCDKLILVDLSEKCIEACRRRFSSSSHITYHVNDGRSLEMIADKSVDFVFSLDSLVHAEADVLEAYLIQLGRKLKLKGTGFVHHSNLGMYAELVARAKQAPPASQGKIIDLQSWRAESMTAKLFEESCDKAGLQCASQELINWFNEFLVDCFSVFTRKELIRPKPNQVVENPHFVDEVNLIRTLAPLYANNVELAV